MLEFNLDEARLGIVLSKKEKDVVRGIPDRIANGNFYRHKIQKCGYDGFNCSISIPVCDEYLNVEFRMTDGDNEEDTLFVSISLDGFKMDYLRHVGGITSKIIGPRLTRRVAQEASIDNLEFSLYSNNILSGGYFSYVDTYVPGAESKNPIIQYKLSLLNDNMDIFSVENELDNFGLKSHFHSTYINGGGIRVTHCDLPFTINEYANIDFDYSSKILFFGANLLDSGLPSYFLNNVKKFGVSIALRKIDTEVKIVYLNLLKERYLANPVPFLRNLHSEMFYFIKTVIS